jgi:hypothetical protein
MHPGHPVLLQTLYPKLTEIAWPGFTVIELLTPFNFKLLISKEPGISGPVGVGSLTGGVC